MRTKWHVYNNNNNIERRINIPMCKDGLGLGSSISVKEKDSDFGEEESYEL